MSEEEEDRSQVSHSFFPQIGCELRNYYATRSTFSRLLFLLVYSRRTDPEYKLKSANQTPTALNNALTNSHEISRNIMDERKAYITGVSEH